jgi:ferrochelatase
VGVLVMAYGSPDRLEDMEAYLLDIRGGRSTSPELVEEIKARYARIGGRSPLLDISRAQAAALEAELNRRFSGSGVDFKARVGMRHWEPRISAAVAQFATDGISDLIGLVMAPHSSRLSTGAYFAMMEAAIEELAAGWQVREVQSWHDHPGLIAAIAERVEAALARFHAVRPFVVFTAHSLPARILAQGDPYEEQLLETAGLLAQSLALEPGRWRFSYQSAGQSREPWLGPAIEAVVAQLAEAGEKNILVVPIGFVCDHVEVLYDIDIACRQLAAERGARLERSESLNTSPAFVSALADMVADTLDCSTENAGRRKVAIP